MENCAKIYLFVHYKHYAPIETKIFNESLFVSSSMNEKQKQGWIHGHQLQRGGQGLIGQFQDQEGIFQALEN